MPPPTKFRNIGLARVLSKLGFCSRSQAAELIRAGRVRLNGTVRRDAETPVHLERDRVEVDGTRITAQSKVYLMMNKPAGLITTASDERGRDTIYTLLKPDDRLPWLAPVGRLDKASEGLLLLTNDSEWGAAVASPESHLPKIYHVQIDRLAEEGLFTALTAGVEIDGELLRASSARLLRFGKKNSWLELALDEGKNRQIRRMLAAFQIDVLRLVRVAIGPLIMGTLPKSSYRPLTNEEKLRIDQAISARRLRDPATKRTALRK